MMLPLVLSGPSRLQFNSNVHLVADGNSLFELVGSNGPSSTQNRVPERTLQAYPLAGSGVTLSNVAIGGQTWLAMASNRADVSSAYQSGKKNILLLWEDTNSIYSGGRSPAQVIEDKAAYVAAERSARNWHAVLCLTTIPREPATSQSQRDTRNAALEEVDDLTWRQFRQMGIDRLVDVRRPGSPFRFANYLPASFDAVQAYFGETSQNTRVHINNAGALLVASWVAQEVAQLRN